MAHLIAKTYLRVNGWGIEGERPEARKFVLIAAPHTSNWDLPYMLAFAGVYDLDISFMAKHTLFAPPMGWIFSALGGIPVRRDKALNMVEQMADEFRKRENLILVIPAEGTRARRPYWKSGFYHIARAAGVPIVPSFLDYARKMGGFGPPMMPTDDVRADMDVMRAFYAGRSGRYPDKFGEVRLREEEESTAEGGEPRE